MDIGVCADYIAWAVQIYILRPARGLAPRESKMDASSEVKEPWSYGGLKMPSEIIKARKFRHTFLFSLKVISMATQVPIVECTKI